MNNCEPCGYLYLISLTAQLPLKDSKLKMFLSCFFIYFFVTKNCFTETSVIQRVAQQTCSSKLILNQPTKWRKWWGITVWDKFRKSCSKMLVLQMWLSVSHTVNTVCHRENMEIRNKMSATKKSATECKFMLLNYHIL